MGRERIRDLIISSVNRIENPKDSLEIRVFRNIDELVDVLLRFLEFRTQEQLLEGIGLKIFSALEVFSEEHIDVRKLPGALEDLSTGFESYLKKIALFKYEGDSTKLRGDGINYQGLLNTPLGGLLEGKVAKVNRSLPALLAPIVTFSYSNNLRENIYEYLRQSRNEIHLSEKKNSFELMNSFRVIVAGYLFALEENFILIRTLVDPVFQYLTKLRNDFQKWDTRYVALSSEERTQGMQVGYPQLQVLEWQDDIDFSRFNRPSFEELIHDPAIDPVSITKSSRKSVAEIANEQRAFWLIGEPGSGKSTTLQALAHQRASEILLSGYLINPFPVFISANRFDKSTSFLHIICDTLQCDLADAEDYLISGKCWLLIDGINEISLGDQEAAFREIERLITSNDETPILLTSRKYNFQAKFGLPVYELLPLTDELVLDFLQKNMKSKDIGQRFFDRLTSSENLLLDFARNPLMLRMLTQVARKDDIPENKGQLFRQFTRWIFSRETRFRKFSANPFFIELVLATIAFKMRSEGKINSPHAIVIDWVAKVVKDLRATSDATQLFHELLDSHILELDLNDGVTFFHELIQEYFCALELKRLYLQNPKSIMDFYLLPIWFEPIAMLSGLLDKAETLIADILPFNIRLAAKCVWSGASVSEATIADIIHYSENIVLDALKNAPPRNDIKRNAYISLLEVGTPESLKTTIRLLSIDDKFSLTTALTSCERPEIATVKLLRFGLTGHKRVFQCLSALRGKTLSSTILNSPEVAAAELKLLEGEIETRSIALIAEIGIPVSIKQDVRVVVSKIVSDFDATDAKWRAAIVIAANEGFTDEILDMITERFSVLKASGQLYYSMFIVCTSLKSKEKQLELAISSARSCLRLQLYGLAIKYISHFNLAKIILFSEIKDQIEKLAFEGRLQLLIEFENAYSNDFTPYVQTAVNKRLQDFTINDMKYIEIFAEKHPNKMEPLIAQKQDLIKNKLISLGKRGHRPRVLRKFIRVLNLQNLFVGVGVIRWFIRKKGYGFISDLNTDRVIFFHMSRVTNRSLLNELRPRMLVAYSFSESSTHPGKLRANSVTVL